MLEKPMLAATPHVNDGADPRRWAMFFVILVGAFLPPLDFFIVNVALPDIGSELHASSAAQQLVISSYASLYGIMLITGGRLGDIYGRSRMFFGGIVGFAIASALCGLAWSPWVLIAGRALQGLTAAIMAPQALASIQVVFPEAEKPRALGIYGAVFGLAAVFGQALGGTLIALDLFGLGWRMIFFVNLPIIALVTVFGLPLLRETRAERVRRPDVIGVGLSILTLACLIVPLIEGREAGWPVWSWVLLAGAIVSAMTFWRYESRLAASGGDPLLDPAIVRTPGMRRGLLVTLLFYAITPFFLVLSIYLQEGLHETPLAAGLTFLPFGLGFLLGPLTTPRLSRSFRYLMSIGMAMEAVGFVALAIIVGSASGHPAPLAVAAALFGIGFGQGLALPTLVRSITQRVSPAYAGTTAGLINSTLQISGALSMAIIGGIFFATVGAQRDGAAVVHGFVVAMLCIGVSLGSAALLSVRLLRPATV
ncbi:MFS transporter [Cupriavidus plantarum]|uniref:MFS transporter n=1 Tax=Cupriavidus plantarum TaxID=942865 RepID=UPI000F25806D|nr:MFS transporter [Cupriavidus plantarum]RLK45696.1 putative MFS family arabinose efflux permease [Cupriavidus plantarum]